MNIFTFEIKSNLKSTLIWMLVLCLVAFLFLQIFPIFYESSASLIEMLQNYPKELLIALDFDPDQFFTVLGFYSFIAVYIQLMAAFQGIIVGLGTMGRETRTRTSEFLLTKPVTRPMVFAMKVASIFTILAVTNLVLLIATILGLGVIDEPYSMGGLLLVSLSTFILQLIFASIGIFCGATFRKLRSIAPVSLSVVFGFFVLNMLKGVFDDPWIRYFSPFQFFDKFEIISTRSFEPVFLMWSLALIVLLVGSSFIIFVRKDIHAL